MEVLSAPSYRLTHRINLQWKPLGYSYTLDCHAYRRWSDHNCAQTFWNVAISPTECVFLQLLPKSISHHISNSEFLVCLFITVHPYYICSERQGIKLDISWPGILLLCNSGGFVGEWFGETDMGVHKDSGGMFF